MKLFLLLVILTCSHAFGKIISEGVFIIGKDLKVIELLSKNSEFVIDHMSARGFELYGPAGLKSYLKKLNIKYSELEIISSTTAGQYPSFIENEKTLKDLALKYPNILKLYSIGKSVKSRPLYVVKLSKNVMIDDNRPEFKYIANMHGDEITGRELMMKLIAHLAINYGRDDRITRLLDRFQIHIMPSMNPDGAELRRRANANGSDLNRDFPDFTTSDNQNTLEGRQPETIAVMNWQKKHNFILSANFHGGAEVVNYPWDTSSSKFPQDELIKELSLSYALSVPYMASSTVFTNGITNGFDWYEVNGGMQDWSIYYHRDMQVTVELSNAKWPDYSEIDHFYNQNLEALLLFMENTEKLGLQTKK